MTKGKKTKAPSQKVESGIAVGGSVGGDVSGGDMDKSVVGKPSQGPIEKLLAKIGAKLDAMFGLK